MPVARHVDRAVRRELGGVDEQLRAVRVRERGELLQRPHLAGDVRGAGDREQVDRAARSARSVTSSSSSAEVVNGSMRRSCRRQGSMLAWCSTGVESTVVPGGSAVARTLIASVVLRTKTTLGPRRADEARDDVARVLVGRGRDLRLRAGAAVHAAVPGHERLDHVPHGGQHRRAGRVVEVDVAARVPVRARHLDVGADQLRGCDEGGHRPIIAGFAWGNLGRTGCPHGERSCPRSLLVHENPLGYLRGVVGLCRACARRDRR